MALENIIHYPYTSRDIKESQNRGNPSTGGRIRSRERQDVSVRVTVQGAPFKSHFGAKWAV
eukprot:scaffold721_cov235-Pinguiococcus_pyrenoidosus.AAC.7